MIRTLIQLARKGIATQDDLFPNLPDYNRGLPMVTENECNGCQECATACPTNAITLGADGAVTLDRGLCIACGACTRSCKTGAIAVDRRTTVAVLKRQDLVLSNHPAPIADSRAVTNPIFRRSIHVREVATGDNATDLEINASTNPIFDGGRFGIHIVASPRHADALAVTGPVPRAMQDPLRRCWNAMAEPRIVIAVGAAAISGVPWQGGYAEANGVDAILPVAAYIPGCPPHPWYILHGLLLAMGRVDPREAR